MGVAATLPGHSEWTLQYFIMHSDYQKTYPPGQICTSFPLLLYFGQTLFPLYQICFFSIPSLKIHSPPPPPHTHTEKMIGPQKRMCIHTLYLSTTILMHSERLNCHLTLNTFMSIVEFVLIRSQAIISDKKFDVLSWKS